MPPSTTSTLPVTYEAAGLAKNNTAAATSSAVPSRLAGIRSLGRGDHHTSPRAAVISLSMNPGATALTVIFRLANSRQTVLVKPMMPAFDAE